MSNQKRWRIIGVSFDHMHMGDLLRMAFNHPNAEIVGIFDPQRERMQQAVENFGIPVERVFTDWQACVERTKPDLAILCAAPGQHALWTERLAAAGVNVLVEKPFAASLADADRMIAAADRAKKLLAINWPLRWVPNHVTAKRLIDEGRIGEPLGVHYYGGNRGPMRHLADKVEVSEEEAARRKSESWFYKKSEGGGSLLDYLGYGVTLGTWYLGGKRPIEVTSVVDGSPLLEVDEHSVTVARYSHGLSKFETRWGTFTDPWLNQPQPKCGFVITGSAGTIGSYDYQPAIRVQTNEHPEGFDVPADKLEPPYRNPIEYLLHCLESGEAPAGPLSPELSRIGQQIVDSAVKSATEKRTVTLVE
jgi:glucose-fructose oxidoreductase